MRFLPVNQEHLLIELENLEQTLSLLNALQNQPIYGVVDLIPAARTILVCFKPYIISLKSLLKEVTARGKQKGSIRPSHIVVDIPVRYDGEDLAEVAQILGISQQELIQRHSANAWSVAFTGFAPGFAYLVGHDPIFNVPRRATPRTSVPAGSVALAGAFSAVYPQSSPGGWQIIGSTDQIMWDLSRDLPALLQPGYRVRFIDADHVVGDTAEMNDLTADIAHALHVANTTHTASLVKKQINPLQHTTASVENQTNQSQNTALLVKQQTNQSQENHQTQSGLKVCATGLLTLFQDLGRAGKAGQGISVSGAVDRTSLRQANRLVGNASHWAVLETVGGGLSLQSIGEQVIAVTGALSDLTLHTVQGEQWAVSCYTPLALADGDILKIGQPLAGARNYIAIRGGFKVACVLGGASRDTLANIGPAPLQVGQYLAIQHENSTSVVDHAYIAPAKLPCISEDVVLDITLGPRTDWFTSEAINRLSEQRWQVTAQSNRIGLRLSGQQALSRTISHELPSEGTVAGAIQVPASGQPVLFLADHPLTGGYPVIACVASHHLDLAGQIPVGAYIRFNPIKSFEELIP